MYKAFAIEVHSVRWPHPKEIITTSFVIVVTSAMFGFCLFTVDKAISLILSTFLLAKV